MYNWNSSISALGVSIVKILFLVSLVAVFATFGFKLYVPVISYIDKVNDYIVIVTSADTVILDVPPLTADEENLQYRLFDNSIKASVLSVLNYHSEDEGTNYSYIRNSKPEKLSDLLVVLKNVGAYHSFEVPVNKASILRFLNKKQPLVYERINKDSKTSGVIVGIVDGKTLIIHDYLYGRFYRVGLDNFLEKEVIQESFLVLQTQVGQGKTISTEELETMKVNDNVHDATMRYQFLITVLSSINPFAASDKQKREWDDAILNLSKFSKQDSFKIHLPDAYKLNAYVYLALEDYFGFSGLLEGPLPDDKLLPVIENHLKQMEELSTDDYSTRYVQGLVLTLQLEYKKALDTMKGSYDESQFTWPYAKNHVHYLENIINSAKSN